MKPRTEIINHRVANSIEQLASFLKPGDIFRKHNSKTQYRFYELKLDEKQVVCENLETHKAESIFYNAPVFKLVFV